MQTERIEEETQLARRLKAARALAGLNVRQVAKACGWSQDKVYRLERGAQEPSALEVAAYARATGQSVEFFIGTSLGSASADGSLSEAQPVENVKDEAAA